MAAVLKPVFLILIGLILFDGVYSQSKQEMIKSIRQEFQKINSQAGLKKTKLENEEFLANMTDGGGELTGFLRNDSIVKIIEWIGISYGNRTREFYFKDQQLFFVYEKFDSFLFDERSGEMNHSKTKTSFEGRYYFNNGKLIEKKLTGKKPLDENNDLTKDAKENIKLLSKKK